MTSKNKGLKVRIFDQGVSALRQIAEMGEDLYVCPICLVMFDKAALQNGCLTLEHVPTESTGGKGIILTCKDCNNKAGHTFEPHLAHKQKLNEFIAVFLNKQEGVGGLAKLEMDGITLNVDVATIQGKTKISILEATNDPAKVKTFQGTVKDMCIKNPQPQLSLKIESREKYNYELAQIGLLKSAYLAAVAKLGYKYALSPALNLIREKISNPKSIPMPAWQIKPNQEMDTSSIAIDFDLGIVVVTFKKESIALPYLAKNSEAYVNFLTSLSLGERIHLHCKALSWPTSFEAMLDHCR